MLSTLREYSTMYPVRNSNAFAYPAQCQISALNPRERAIHAAVQIAASFVLGACALRWKPNRSMASTQSTPALKAIQSQRFVCMKIVTRFEATTGQLAARGLWWGGTG